MLIIGFFRWWYGQGWLTAADLLKQKLSRLLAVFSVPILLKTLFKPWRQIVAPEDPNAQIDQRLRMVVDNVISRFIGFWVRVLTVVVAMVTILLVGAAGLVGLLLWPLAPVAIFWLLLRGIGLT